jgi:cellulose biosynthesis protein BcsQ
MKIMLYNIKGGQGKTDIALNLALTLDYNFITNEPLSPVEMVMREGRFVKLNQTDDLPEIPPEYDVIFDFGGYLDKRAITALKQADRVIVPVVNEFKDVHTTVNFIQEIEAYSQNIFIVANKTQKGDFTDIQAIMQKFYPKYPVFEIKHSRAMPNILKEKKSIREMVGEGGLKKFNYGAVDKQFNLLIKAIL